MTRSTIITTVALVSLALGYIVGLWVYTAKGTQCQQDQALAYANTLADLYTVNLYETENPRAQAALRRALPGLREACRRGCPEDLRIILGRLESLKKEETHENGE